MADIIFHNVKEDCFEILGLYDAHGDHKFQRIPDDVAQNTSPTVYRLREFPTGGRVRFRTNSKKVIIKAKTRANFQCHMTPLVCRGFELYLDLPHGTRFIKGTNITSWECEDIEEAYTFDGWEYDITINLPVYGTVEEMYIGLEEGCVIKPHKPYKYMTPIVFYGSSITHGVSASRPGKTYPMQISGKYDCNFTNLGFSGSCLAEDAIVDYMSTLEMSAFVCDYDHNAPTVEYLRDTHHKMYRKIREKHPKIPYFMISRPNFHYSADDFARRAVIMQSYLDALNAGDKNVYFIDGMAFGNGMGIVEYTVDSCHPTDDGFVRMADYIGDVIATVMKFK